MKPEIEIWDTVGLGLIISYPTGVLVSNQTGGSACLHPKLEGIYLPFANDYSIGAREFISPEIELSEYFLSNKYYGTGAINGIDLDDVKAIELIFEKYSLLEFIEIDRQKISDSHEAWIWVKINYHENNMLLQNFENYPRTGVLTWSNSD